MARANPRPARRGRRLNARRARQQRLAERDRLAGVYAQVPQVACKGLCADACGPIHFSAAEAERMRAALGGPLPVGDAETGVCPLLDAERRCTVYAARPLTCRLYGAVTEALCGFGCEIAGDPLPIAAGRELLTEIGVRGAHGVQGQTMHDEWWRRHGAEVRRMTLNVRPPAQDATDDGQPGAAEAVSAVRGESRSRAAEPARPLPDVRDSDPA